MGFNKKGLSNREKNINKEVILSFTAIKMLLMCNKCENSIIFNYEASAEIVRSKLSDIGIFSEIEPTESKQFKLLINTQSVTLKRNLD